MAVRVDYIGNAEIYYYGYIGNIVDISFDISDYEISYISMLITSDN